MERAPEAERSPRRKKSVSTTKSPKPSRRATQALARSIAKAALSKKAEDVLILDLRELSSACDFFVLASGGAAPHVKAICDHIEETLRASGERPWHVEGRASRSWILLDYVHVVVHLFLKETREYYMLERLWADAPREEVKDRPRRRPAVPEEA